MLMVGRYPIVLIMMQVPAPDVDVNVHPAKAEVRFRKSDEAFSSVERAVRRTLTQRAPVPQIEPMADSRWQMASGVFLVSRLDSTLIPFRRLNLQSLIPNL